MFVKGRKKPLQMDLILNSKLFGDELWRSKVQNVFISSRLMKACSYWPNIDYIHNWPLQCFSHDYGLASHTSVTSALNDRFLRNFFMAGLFTLKVFESNLLREKRQRNIFSYFILMPGLEYEIQFYV